MNIERVRKALDAFFRKQLPIFSLKDVKNYLSKRRIYINDSDLLMITVSYPNVIPISNDSFITRAGLFTGVPFSIKPTKFEINNNILFLRHRFMPFVDNYVLPNEICVRFFGTIITKKVLRVPSNEVAPLYKLFGDEFVPQIISLDTANKGNDFSESDFLLPTYVDVTVLDCTTIYDFFKFKYGDRIQAVVSNWNKSVVEIIPYIDKSNNPFEENDKTKKYKQWFKDAEKGLLQVFKKYGPCKSIDEQLLHLYLENRRELCIAESGSIDELLEKSKKIQICDYGVESRLWQKGCEISASYFFIDAMINSEHNQSILYNIDGLPVSDEILIAFIYDMFYHKEEDYSKIIKKFYPNKMDISKKKFNNIMLHLQEFGAIIKKDYNWFADYEIGKLRKRALALYLRLLNLEEELGYYEKIIDNFPQQQLVIFAQLSKHVARTIISFSNPYSIADEEISSIEASLFGMELSFEEINTILLEEIKKQEKKFFTLVKAED